MSKTLTNKNQQLFFTSALLVIVAACDNFSGPQNNSADAGALSFAQDVDPIGEPIEGETLAIVLCTQPQSPDIHGAGLQIGGRSLGQTLSTPHNHHATMSWHG